MKHPLLLTSLFLLASLHTSFSQQTSANDAVMKVLQKNGEKFLKNKNIHAVSIGVYIDGQTYTQHLGELEKGQGNPPNDQSLYEVGSVSKTLTGYLVAKAVLEQKLKLEDDIRMYLDGNYSNLEVNGTPITVKNLLTHTSGLPMFLPNELNGLFETLLPQVPEQYLALEKSYTKAKFFDDLAQVTLTHEPGTDYVYSNAGVEIIGHILEVVYDKSIATLLEENFANPHGMTQTAIHLDEAQLNNVVRGRWMGNQTPSPIYVNPLWGTGSGYKMTMTDMLQYMALQLDENNPITVESHQPLYEIRSPLHMAYFWQVWTDKYGTSYNHHGGTSGTQNWLYIFPKYNLGISIITNHSGPKTPNLLRKAAQKMVKELVEN